LWGGRLILNCTYTGNLGVADKTLRYELYGQSTKQKVQTKIILEEIRRVSAE
jgi:hypothetical protein